jgi:hypothetical protein
MQPRKSTIHPVIEIRFSAYGTDNIPTSPNKIRIRLYLLEVHGGFPLAVDLTHGTVTRTVP